MQQIRFREPPCNGCPLHHLRCKETCPRWKTWKAEFEEENSRVHRLADAEKEITNYKVIRCGARKKLITKRY